MAARNNDYSMDELETKYNDITVLYDFAEQLVSTVESELVRDPNTQLDIVEPLIAEIGDATDILSQEFILIAEAKKRKTQNRASKAQIEGALRKIYAAISDYNARVQNVTKKAHGSIMNIADPIVQKIQRQLEQVVVIFMDFIQISLQNVMSKMELEALKVRDARIALMMHQQAQTLSQQS